MIKLQRVFKDYDESGALHANIGVLEAIDDNSFLTKAGHLFRMLRVDGLDDECLEPGQVDHIALRLEAGLRLLDENFRLYQYLIKTHAKPIEYGKSKLPVVQEALETRAAYLNARQLHQIDLYWAIVYEGSRFDSGRNGLGSFLRGAGQAVTADLFEWKNTAASRARAGAIEADPCPPGRELNGSATGCSPADLAR